MSRNPLIRTLCSLALLLSSSFPLTAQQKEKPPEGGKPKAFNLPPKQAFTLKNGIEVALVPFGKVPKVSVNVVVRSGNLNEKPDQVWLADVMGDLLKEGTTTRSAEQIAQETAQMGGSIFVGTGAEQTTIGGSVLSEFGADLVKLLADVVQRPAFPASELPRIKNNRLRNLAIQKAQPGTQANEKFYKVIYGDHSFGRRSPTEAMLKGYTIEQVQNFYKENFGAARTRIYVAGNFDAAAMKKAIMTGFESWEKGAAPITDVPKTAKTKSIHLIDRPGAVQSTIYLGLPVVDPSHPDYIALEVTDAILGGAFASRITANIREQKGYTYSPSSFVATHYRDAFWVESADVTTAVTGASIKEIFYEIERLQKEPPPVAELNGIKNYLAGLFVIQNSSREGLMGQLSFSDFHGLGDSYVKTYVQRVQAVTPQDVQRIMQTYLRPEKMTLVVVGDKSKIADQLTPYGEITY
jgi:zinc protease